jgi:chromosome segregation ATPase
MNVARTITFLLENQARFDVKMAKADARMAKAEARMTRHDARMRRHDARMRKVDQRIEKLEKLVHHLTILMSQQQAALHRMNKKTDERFAELARNMNNFLRAQARRNGSGR